MVIAIVYQGNYRSDFDWYERREEIYIRNEKE